MKDWCADLDREPHKCLPDKLFPSQAKVLAASEFVSAMNS
jgi:hypothetical protein